MLSLEFPRHLRDRYSLAEGAVAAIATATATMHESSFGAAPVSTSASRSSIPPGGRDGPPGSRTGRRVQSLFPCAREPTQPREGDFLLPEPARSATLGSKPPGIR